MANPKKPARKRKPKAKAAKAVMAWAGIFPDGEIVCSVFHDKRPLVFGTQAAARGSFTPKIDVVRVKIVEVRR